MWQVFSLPDHRKLSGVEATLTKEVQPDNGGARKLKCSLMEWGEEIALKKVFSLDGPVDVQQQLKSSVSL